MDEVKEKLRQLIVEKDLSAIELMAKAVNLDEDRVIEILEEMQQEGLIVGRITEDRRRFFRGDLEIEPKGVEEDVPEFLKFDARPWKIIATIGLIILIAALILRSFFAGNIELENAAYVMFFIGIMTMMFGCYRIGQRKTP